MGILPTPGENQSFSEAYAQASEYCEFSPVWGRPTPFYNLADDLNGEWGRTFVKEYIRDNGMFPIININFYGAGVNLITPPGQEGATLDNPEWRNAYKQAVLNSVKATRPLYLSIGNEVNRWYEKYGAEEGNPNGFQHYISLYEEIYDSIKEISPQTNVFCTFAREIVTEYRTANLDILNIFPTNKLDILVFTSYPYAVSGINRPADIPDDYYVQTVANLPNKPFGFTELGWPAMTEFGGEQAQANFITQVAERLTKQQGINLRLFGWAWLHDLDENDHIGLIKRDGTEKLAYAVWKTLSTSPAK
ncbi:MAG: hypothetical protein ABIK93_05180 [candidate division WOR-3 bacterium]